jgi:hypothetical protein
MHGANAFISMARCISPAEALAREAVAEVQAAVRKAFELEARVLPLGSVVQGTNIDGSDLDLYVDIPDYKDSRIKALESIMKQLSPNCLVKSWKFDVPLVMLTFTNSYNQQIQVDVSVGSDCNGIEKGLVDRLIRRLIARHRFCLPLVRFVKHWAKVEGLTKTYKGYMPSLAWTLVVLYFYATRGQLDMDCLKDEEENERGEPGVSHIPPFFECDSEVVAPELLRDFFSMVADWAALTEKPRHGSGPWGISLHGEVQGQSTESAPFFIAAPHPDLSVNVASDLREGTWRTILRKCRSAADTLRGDESPFCGDENPFDNPFEPPPQQSQWGLCGQEQGMHHDYVTYPLVRAPQVTLSHCFGGPHLGDDGSAKKVGGCFFPCFGVMIAPVLDQPVRREFCRKFAVGGA